MGRGALILVVFALAAGAVLPAGAAALPTCGGVPDPTRWVSAGIPDQGAPMPMIMPHRGGPTLAPEESIDAYRTALAFGADGFEGDVRVSADGVYVLSHDETVGRLTGRTGTAGDVPVSSLTVAQLKQLNTANYGDFALSAPPGPKQTFNPSHFLTLAEALDLAEAYGVGMDLDVKAVPDAAALASFVARWPVAFAHIFFEANPDEVLAMRNVEPNVNAMYNLGGPEPPGFLFALTQAPWHYRFFGSSLDKFTPERNAEIHDGCGMALPHDYDGDPPDEPAALRQGRAVGTDGAQLNSPDVAAAVYGRPVDTRVQVARTGPQSLRACLLNADRRLGVPYRRLTAGASSGVTGRGGCTTLAGRIAAGTAVTWAGDAAARASAGRAPR